MAHDEPLEEQALPIGAELCGGQFTITTHLGAGGFGKTYRAVDNVLGRTVVIKECFPSDFCVRERKSVVARSKSYVEPVRSIIDMFMREARSLAKLRHPNIVGVHRAFEENETAYMALDLIDGPDLLGILHSGDTYLSPRRVKNILWQMLDAIEKVHEVDLLHRDISPDNIIIEETGTPVLIDFGAARGDASRRTRAVSSMLVVKDGYSPQEFYVAGSPQEPCSDLYALGATFYHVLSGSAPPSSQTRLLEIAGQRPDPCKPLTGRIAGYEPEFLNAIDTAMKVHPADRLQTAARWKTLIADLMDQGPQTSRPASLASPQDISLNLQRSLSRLVQEANTALPEEPRPARREPVFRPVPPRKPVRPDWVNEFNRESISAELEVALREMKVPEPEPEEPGSVTHEEPEEDWGDTEQTRSRSRTPREIEAIANKARSRIRSTLSGRTANLNDSGGPGSRRSLLRPFGASR